MRSADFLTRVGATLRRARWAAGLTQEQVAGEGVTARYYQELERGQRNPSLAMLFRLAKILRTTVAALVDVDPAATADAKARLDSPDVEAPPVGRKPGRPRQKPRRRTDRSRSGA